MKGLLVLACASALICSFAESVHAKTARICNYSTSPTASVAISRYRRGSWLVEGWYPIRQGKCVDFFHEGAYFYYYGTSVGVRWSGSIPHCTLSKAFTLVYRRYSCRGGTWKYFQQVRQIDQLYTVRLTE
ncbi:DUF1036 domain-containing protein [Okeania sp. SIO2B3]|uniref:DUF1036 domain-containing protein n=1 Tax=Okeania sp. SIO2B3 TaxID=2607784 RepID=UPI0013C05312|nr:DUF1036 domain-containing protein [Okeania sp. SIO2B3]NET42356.1 DUF1036 domain-containing protein [Okeania sp. SIO2B3]